MSLNQPNRSTDRPSTALNPLKTLTAENPTGKAVGNINPYLPQPPANNGLADGLMQVAQAFGQVSQRKRAEEARQLTALKASQEDLTAANKSLEYNTGVRVLKQKIQEDFPNNPEVWVEEFEKQAPELAVNSVADIQDEVFKNKLLKGMVTSQISEGDSLFSLAESRKNKKLEAETEAALQNSAQSMALAQTPDDVFRAAIAISAHGAEVASRLGNPDIAKAGDAAVAKGILNALSGWARDETKARTLLDMIEGKITFETGIQNEDGTPQKVRITDFIDATRLNALYNAGQQDIRQQKALEKEEATRKYTIDTIDEDADFAADVIAGNKGLVEAEQRIEDAKGDPNTTPARIKRLESQRLAILTKQQQADKAATEKAEKEFKQVQVKARARAIKYSSSANLDKNVILEKAIKRKDWATAAEIYTNAASEIAVAQALGALDENEAALYFNQVKVAMLKDFTKGKNVTDAVKIQAGLLGKPLDMSAKYLRAWVALQAPGKRGVLEQTAGETYRAMQRKMDAGKPMTEAQIEAFFRGRLKDRLNGRVK